MSRVATLAALLVLTACGGGSDSPPDVDWSEYPPSTKKIAGENFQAKDCEAMQEMFDTFDQRGDSADLLAYLDEQLEKAGCYA